MNVSETTARKLRIVRYEAKSIITISIGIVGLVIVFILLSTRINLVHDQSFHNTCQKVNVIGGQVTGFIDSTVDRSTKALKATLASPSATADQKSTAIRNLSALKVVQQDAHTKIHPLDCESGHPVTTTTKGR